MNFIGTGLNRVVGLRRDLQVYKDVLFEFVQRRDADDDKSPHWINPTHGLFFSKQPVAFEEVPQSQLFPMSLAQSLGDSLLDVGLLVGFNVLFFLVGFVGFLRYDVR